MAELKGNKKRKGKGKGDDDVVKDQTIMGPSDQGKSPDNRSDEKLNHGGRPSSQDTSHPGEKKSAKKKQKQKNSDPVTKGFSDDKESRSSQSISDKDNEGKVIK